jgi:hypothetical protein
MNHTADVSIFTIDSERKEFISEVSTMQFRELKGADDLIITNPKTGNSTHWNLSVFERNSAGELECFVLRPTNDTLREFPQLIGWRVKLFNT